MDNRFKWEEYDVRKALNELLHFKVSRVLLLLGKTNVYNREEIWLILTINASLDLYSGNWSRHFSLGFFYWLS